MNRVGETILKVYRHGQWRLRVYRDGDEIRIEDPSGNTPTLPLTHSFDRVELFSEPAQVDSAHFIIDAIPYDDVNPYPSRTYIRVCLDDRGELDIDLHCHVRNYLSGEFELDQFGRRLLRNYITVSGTIVVYGNRIKWVRFNELRFGTASHPHIVEFHRLPLYVAAAGRLVRHGLLNQIGPSRGISRRHVYSGRSASQMSFFRIGTRTANGIDYPLFVLRFEQEFSFSGSLPSEQNYDVSIGPIRMSVTGAELKAVASGKLTQTLLPKQSSNLEPNPGEYGNWVVSVEGLPSGGIANAWNESVARPYLASLHTVEAGQPISSIGFLDAVNTQPHWIVGIKVIDQNFNDRDLLQWILDETSNDFYDGEGVRPNKQLLSLRCVLPHPLITSNDAYLDYSVRNLVRHDGDHLTVRASVEPFNVLTENDVYFANDGFLFKLRQRFPQTPDPELREQRCRVGALDAAFTPKLATTDLSTPIGNDHEESEFQVAFRRVPSGSASFLPIPDVKCRWQVDRIEPGGQDDPPTERSLIGIRDRAAITHPDDLEIEKRFNRENPVVILTNPATDHPTYTLEIEESTSDYQSQELSMRLRFREDASSGVQELQRIVVLDRHPLTVAEVKIPHFAGIGGADGTSEVGNWSEQGFEGASWELSGSSEGFPLRLPPQAFGEASEQFKEGEIPIDVTEDLAADFRLSSPSHFELFSSFFRQNFTEAPWNLRRILGYPGQRAPGAEVRSLEFELLYGLSCQIDYPFLRLAEITARMGAVARALPRELFSLFDADRLDSDKGWDADAYTQYKQDYSHQFVAYLSRLGVLEPRDSNQLGTLTVDDAIQYYLRDRPAADHKPPFPSDIEGLAGGALWGVYSQGLYRRLLNLRRSSSGLISRPYFSALGGWGYQKASFDNDTTTIYSDTSMGRVFFYSVETIGHIGVWWNTAKHVVVFERRVVPHKDTLFDYTDEQDPLLGRPVVREVARYVEIMQPTRNFPDFDASVRAPGVVSGIEFKSTIIPVKTEWQKDVYDPNGRFLGFAVRLWDGRSSPTPQIVERCAAPDGSGSETVPPPVIDPQKLVFFAYKGPGTGTDTDAWPSIGWVDYPHLAANDDDTTNPIRLSNAPHATPVPPASPDVSPYVEGDLDGIFRANIVSALPTDNALNSEYNENPSNAAGASFSTYKRFTLKLGSGSRAVDLLAGRSKTPLTAVLRTITAVRSDIATRGKELEQGKVLQLLRAYGQPPIASGMSFNRPSVAYYFDTVRDAIETSPMTALVSRANNDVLKPLGVRLPTRELLDRVVPYEEKLQDLDLSQMLPDFAGLKLSKLLPGLKIPNPLDSKRVKITHNFDPQTQSGWIQADINIPISKPTTLFSVDPVEVLLRDATFFAIARIESGGSGTPTHRVNGRIEGDWELHVGSLHVLTFVDTPLSFDDKGNTRFEISAHRVRLHGILTLLSDLLAKLSDPDSGFTLRLITEDDLPIGVEAILELPLPDLSFGVTSIANMQFGTSLALRARPEFELAIRAHLSEEDAPFAIIIFILGGAGFVDVRARYLPFSGNMSSDVTVGLSVGAMIGFAFGPFKGSVYIFLGVAATLHTDHTEGEQTLAYHIILVIGGEVDVFGFISVSIKAQLKLTYSQGNFSGKGSVSIRVKLCWLVTVSASASVEYEFGGSGSEAFLVNSWDRVRLTSDLTNASRRYLHMLV